MSGMSPAQLLLGSLALKIVMTAGIVVAASVVVERSGPFIGALIASLPTAGGAALIILAFDHSPEFIAAGIVGSMIAIVISAPFALTYAALAQRHSLARSLVGAFVVWFAAVFLSRLVPWTALSASLLTMIVFPAAIYLSRGFRDEGKAKPRLALTHRDLAWRAGVVTLCVILVTGASTAIGPYFSGVFAFFPVAMSSFFIILHSRISRHRSSASSPAFSLCIISRCRSAFGGPISLASPFASAGMRCCGLRAAAG